MFKELKETIMSKELEESMRIISHQIQTVSKKKL